MKTDKSKIRFSLTVSTNPDYSSNNITQGAGSPYIAHNAKRYI
ncbi:MAG TPA: hypothetical protein VE978_04545 [Chitinophagales bacterium]|nr:hypothetical protein [Chitinophagales bacterium]